MSNGAHSTHIKGSPSSALLQHTPELESLLSKLRPFQRAAFDFAVHGIPVGGNGDSGSRQIKRQDDGHIGVAGSGTGRLLLGDEMGLG
jgi:hypothetical protein